MTKDNLMAAMNGMLKKKDDKTTNDGNVCNVCMKGMVVMKMMR